MLEMNEEGNVNILSKRQKPARVEGERAKQENWGVPSRVESECGNM